MESSEPNVVLEAEERLKKHSELAGVAREVLQLLSGDLFQKSRESLETVDKIRSKVKKGKENTTNTIESKHTCLLAIAQCLVVRFIHQ